MAAKSNRPASMSAYSTTGSNTSTTVAPIVDSPSAARSMSARRAMQVAADPLALAPERLGELLRRRAAVGGVELDAEIAVGAARVVARRQDDRAEGGALSHDAARRRRRQDAGAADEDAAEPVRRRHADDDLDRMLVVEAAVAADDERRSGEAGQRIEDRLDEVLEIVRLLEHRDLLAQARRAGALVGEGGGRTGFDVGHGSARGRPRAAATRERPTIARGAGATKSVADTAPPCRRWSWSSCSRSSPSSRSAGPWRAAAASAAATRRASSRARRSTSSFRRCSFAPARGPTSRASTRASSSPSSCRRSPCCWRSTRRCARPAARSAGRRRAERSRHHRHRSATPSRSASRSRRRCTARPGWPCTSRWSACTR